MEFAVIPATHLFYRRFEPSTLHQSTSTSRFSK